MLTKMAKRSGFELLTGMFLLVTLSAGTVRAGQIKGAVRTADGKPVQNAHVTVNVRPDPTQKAPVQPFSRTVETGPDGSFVVDSLPAGTFAVCTHLTSLDLLPDCSWESKEPTVVLSATQTASLPIVLKKGVHLAVRIADPSGVAARSEGVVPGATVFVGIRSPNGRVLPMAGQLNGNGRDFDLLVPPDTDLELHLFSKVLAVQDGKGKALGKDTGEQVPVRVNSGGAPPSLNFSVTGLH